MTPPTATPPSGRVTYRAGGWRFRVVCDRPDVAEQIAEVLVDLRDPAPAVHVYVLRCPVGDEVPGVLLLDDSDEIAESYDTGLLYRTLLWHLNTAVVASCPDRVVLHAACASRPDGAAVLLPAVSGSGKTTLVAGLVRAGLRYVTDEAVLLDPVSGYIAAYPKPLKIERGSWEVLAELNPARQDARDGLSQEQWQVPASRFGTLAANARPALTVLPRYRPGRETVLTPVSRGELLVELVHSTFAPERAPARDFAALADLTRNVPGWRLENASLDEAVGNVLQLLEQQP